MKKFSSTNSTNKYAQLIRIPLNQAWYTLSLIFLSLCFSSFILGQAISPGLAPVTPPTGFFRIEGDLKANTPANTGDWLPGAGGTGGSVLNASGAVINSATTFHRTDLFTSGDNIFSGGLKKDADLTKYTWKNGNPSPGKCDINHLLVHIADAANGDTWITLAGDREEINGNSFISIALLQKTLTANANFTFTSGAPSSTGGRTVGDVQISAEFTGGGDDPNLYLEEWRLVGTEYKWVSFSIDPIPAFGSTNSAELTAMPYSVFTNNTYQINAFIEVSFNISEIYRNTATACVGSIASMFVLTKSSQAVNADLADFVDPLQINLDINVGKPTATGASYCVGQTIADLTVTGEAGAVFKWYTAIDANGEPTGSSTTGATYSPGINNSVPGTYDFYVTQTLKGCEGDPTKVTIIINANPTADAGDAPTAQCYVAAGNVFNLTGTGVNGTPAWTIAPNGNPSNLTVGFSGENTLQPTITISGSPAGGTVTLRLTVTSNASPSCGNVTDDVSIQVNPNPTTDAGTDPVAQCYVAAGNIFDLIGTVTNGTPEWTIAPNGNPSNLTVGFSGANTLMPTITISGNPAGGSVTLRLTATSDQIPSCGNKTDDIILTVTGQVGGPDAVMLAVLCTDATFKVKINSPVQGTKYTVTQPLNNNPYSAEFTFNGSNGPVEFSGLKFGDGFKVIASKDGCTSLPTDCPQNSERTGNQLQPITQFVKPMVDLVNITDEQPTVKAYPNPFSDKVRFQVKSAQSGSGTLEVFNILGQKVKTVYQGFVPAGVNNYELSIPKQANGQLFYRLSIGKKQVTGKLMQIKQ